MLNSESTARHDSKIKETNESICRETELEPKAFLETLRRTRRGSAEENKPPENKSQGAQHGPRLCKKMVTIINRKTKRTQKISCCTLVLFGQSFHRDLNLDSQIGYSLAKHVGVLTAVQRGNVQLQSATAKCSCRAQLQRATATCSC